VSAIIITITHTITRIISERSLITHITMRVTMMIHRDASDQSVCDDGRSVSAIITGAGDLQGPQRAGGRPGRAPLRPRNAPSHRLGMAPSRPVAEDLRVGTSPRRRTRLHGPQLAGREGGPCARRARARVRRRGVRAARTARAVRAESESGPARTSTPRNDAHDDDQRLGH
jgi:hypothetical protein